jgi:hypothetical protein
MNIDTMTLIKTTPAMPNTYGWTEQRVYKLASGGYFWGMATVTPRKNTLDPTSGGHISEAFALEIIAAM